MILIAIILNIINYISIFILMPNISVIVFFFNCYIVPGIYNGILYFYCLTRKQRQEKLNLVLLPALSTIAYSISSLLLVKSGKFEVFMKNNTVNTGNVHIKINDNLFSLSQIIYIFILYIALLFIIKKIRGGKNDPGRKYKEEV